MGTKNNLNIYHYDDFLITILDLGDITHQLIGNNILDDLILKEHHMQGLLCQNSSSLLNLYFAIN